MRKLFFAAAATAPLLACAGAGRAQTTVSTATTTPLATSSAGDVTVTSTGSITPATATPAVTVDSDNAVYLGGAVTSSNVNGATGVLLQGGHTGSLTATAGGITVSETYAPTDSVNGDGVVEAPFAQGTGRYGVRLTGAAPFTGAISLAAPVTVRGQGSYGVSLEAPLAGALSLTGGVSLTGDAVNGAGGVAVQELAGVSGPVTLGAVAATGQGARAVVLGGDVGGTVLINSGVSATGYSITSRQSDTVQGKLQATPTDVEQAGEAVTVAANLAGGLYLSAPPAGTVAGSTADLDGDGVPDGSEGTGGISQYGRAAALLVGASGKAITLGNVGAGDNAYGVLLRGGVSASGLEDGVAATAVQIGTGDGTVSLTGGLRNTGTIAATAYEADSTALHLLSGAQGAALRNDGAISATISDSTLTSPQAHGTASAVLIEAGASLPSLVNSGAISATGAGGALTVQAVVDRSGTLSSVTNTGTIAAGLTPASASDALTGSATALDLRANTTGVRLTQQLSSVTSTSFGSTAGSDAVGTTTVTPLTPAIIGDVYLGSGFNDVSLLAGSMTGALSFGGGPTSASALTLDNGATYTGALTYAGSLALNVNNGSLIDLSSSPLKLSSLSLGAAGKLTVTVDPAAANATQLAVSGPATIAQGATLAVRLVSAPSSASGAQTFTLISSPQLSFSGDAGSLGASTSFLFSSTFAVNQAAGTISLTVARRSAADLGLTTSEGAGLDAVLAGSGRDPNLLQALLAPSAKGDFTRVYDQLLPEHSGVVFLAAQQAAEAVGRAATEPRNTPDGSGAWTQEFVLGVEEDRQTAAGSHAGGFGFAGGAETDALGVGQVGVSAAFFDARVTDPDIGGDTYSSFFGLESGLYWRASLGGLKLSARGAGGYLFGTDRRDIKIAATEGVPALAYATKGSWHGWTADASAGAAYEFTLGRVFIRPGVTGEYFRLTRDAYTEEGGGDAVNLALDARSGDAAFGTASVTVGGRFGRDIVWRPSLEVGARDVFSGDAGMTTARFAAGGDSFTLTPNPITGVGYLAKAALKISSPNYELTFDADGQDYSHYREGVVRAGVSFVF